MCLVTDLSTDETESESSDSDEYFEPPIEENEEEEDVHDDHDDGIYFVIICHRDNFFGAKD